MSTMTNLDSATVQITTGYQSGEDVLAFANQSGITGSLGFYEWNIVAVWISNGASNMKQH